MTTMRFGSGPAYERAIHQRNAGDLHGAIATLSTASPGPLANAAYATTLAKMLYDVGEVARADRWFRHAFKLAPNDLIVRQGYGTHLSLMDRHEEAHALLSSVAAKIRRCLTGNDWKMRKAILEADGFIASTELNLAAACLDLGDTAGAFEHSAPWLADPDVWPWAHRICEDVQGRQGRDALEFAAWALSSGPASPPMVRDLIEARLAATPCDSGTLYRLVWRAEKVFNDFVGWRQAVPGLDAVMGRAHRQLTRAVMVRDVDLAPEAEQLPLFLPATGAQATRLRVVPPAGAPVPGS